MLKLRTYQKELLVVAGALGLITYGSSSAPIEYLGDLAVLFTFAHAQIGFRFTEASRLATECSKEPVGAVTCAAKMDMYFVAKEACWLLYFAAHGAWSALAGVFIFLIYPVWRGWYKSKKA